MSDATRGALAATSPRTAPDGATAIAAKALALAFARGARYPYENVVDALARAGWLVDPDRLAALEAVAEAVRTIRRAPAVEFDNAVGEAVDAVAALDDLPAPTPGGVL